MSTIIMMVLLFVVFYFFMIRPPAKEGQGCPQIPRETCKKAPASSLLVALHGKVVEVNDKTVLVEVTDGVKLPL
jgi:preprotein translocase subunit YajC